ncbi:MAG: DUF4097 domain-containing protein [Erysipelothrix sp.]|nr:DUF4097 domain-containing protein [Erysipelothrix sp.]
MRNKRINKILGTILAITLPLTIIGVVALTLMSPGNMMGNMSNNMWNNSMWGHINNGHMNNGGHMGNSNSISSDDKYKGITKIKTSNIISDLEIKPSENDETWVEYNGKRNVVSQVSGNTLTIKDKSMKMFGINMKGLSDKNERIVIYISSEDISLDLELAVSDTYISNVKLSSLEIEGGVGRTKLENITVHKDIEISGGIGETELINVNSNKLDIEVGVGKITINKLEAEKVDIDGGIGSITINNATIKDLKTETGIGSLTINNSDIQNHKKD